MCYGLVSVAQTPDYPFAVGIHGGVAQYSGDLGNDFYHLGKRNQPFYGQVGVSLSYYLARRLDIVGMFLAGEIGHFEGPNYIQPEREPMRFRVSSSTLNIYLRYHLLSSSYIFRPYLLLGTGIMRFNSTGGDIGSGWSFHIPTAGAGVNIRLSKRFNLQVQETFMYASTDRIDGVKAGFNDLFVFHTIGLTYQFSLHKKSGVGDAIDRCTDQSKRAKKVKP